MFIGFSQLLVAMVHASPKSLGPATSSGRIAEWPRLSAGRNPSVDAETVATVAWQAVAAADGCGLPAMGGSLGLDLHDPRADGRSG